MVKDVEMFIILGLLLISVLMIFNARFIVKNKLRSVDENRAVVILKCLGYVLAVISLLGVYYVNMV